MKKRQNRKSNGSKASSFIKSIDLFGQNVGFLVNGDQSFKTWTGTMISLLIFIVVAYYGVQKFNILRGKLDTTFLRTEEADVIDKEEPFTFADTQFNIAFGL